jgi:SAV_6107-like HEPN
MSVIAQARTGHGLGHPVTRPDLAHGAGRLSPALAAPGAAEPHRIGPALAPADRADAVQAEPDRIGLARVESDRAPSIRPAAGRVTPSRTAPSALALVESARHGLAAASEEVSAGGRYVAAHLAALRAAAAVVTAKAEPPSTRRQRPQSVWALLPKVEPALAEWAAFFAAGAAKRAAAEAGLPRAVSMREADELLRDAETFVSLAEGALGILPQPLLPLAPAG